MVKKMHNKKQPPVVSRGYLLNIIIMELYINIFFLKKAISTGILHTYKMQTFYTFSSHLDLGTHQSYQGCLKSCIIHKRDLFQIPCGPRDSFWDVFRTE